jgi:cytochrome c553
MIKKLLQTIAFTASITILFTACGDNYKDSLTESGLKGTSDQSTGALLFEQNGCTGCHGVDAGTSALGKSRIIADIASQKDVQNALYSLRAQTPGFDPIMLAQAKNLGDQEILDLASYIFSLRH